MGRPNKARQKKKQQRQKRIRKQHNLSRSKPRSPIEDMPEEGTWDDSVIDDGDMFLPDIDPALIEEERSQRKSWVDSGIGHRVLQEVAGELPVPDREHAQELAYRALLSSHSDEAVEIAERSLTKDPNCLDARVVQAFQGQDDWRVIAMQLGEIVELPSRALEDSNAVAGESHGLDQFVEAKPYLRALKYLADAHAASGDLNSAANTYARLLRLAPQDEYGVRDALIQVFLHRGMLLDAADLLDEESDTRLVSPWLRLLALFETGDRKAARREYLRLRRQSGWIAPLLIDEPLTVPHMRGEPPSDPNIATLVFVYVAPAWDANRKAASWLAGGAKSTRKQDRHEAKRSYRPPVAALLREGRPSDSGEWLDYPTAFTLGTNDVPQLCRMATDQALHETDEGEACGWAPVHAWRALAQLGASEAIAPLLAWLCDEVEDDCLEEDFGEIAALIGPGCIDCLSDFLQDRDVEDATRSILVYALWRLAEVHPDSRDQVGLQLTSCLRDHTAHSPSLNSSIIEALAAVEYGEAEPLVRDVFDSGRYVEIRTGSPMDVLDQLGGPASAPRPR